MVMGSYNYCVLALFVAVSFNQAAAGLQPCRGVFDMIFVLDKSGSISGNFFASSAVEFVRNVSSHFVSPLLAMSLITFSDQGKVYLNLTSDRDSVDKALTELSTLQGAGGTHMSEGLSKAIQQIEQKRSQSSVALDDNIVSVIVILTDGKVNSLPDTLNKARRARQLGAVLYAVGVANYDLNQLEQVADSPSEDHVFLADNFADLPRLVDAIINKTCIEILAAYPTIFCSEGNHSIVVDGNGFTRGRSANEIVCNFRVNGTTSYKTRPQQPVRDDLLVCKSPRLSTNERGIILQISVNNGKSYVSSNVSLSIIKCETGSSINGALIAALIIIFAVLFLLLLWWFWPLCVGGVIAAESEDETDDKLPPRTVSASYYGGRGPGGMREIRVDWGDKGSTGEGSKLTPAKDATVTEPPVPPSSSGLRKEPGCWDRMKGAFSGCWAVVVAKYVYVASFRPVKGQSCCNSGGKRSGSYSPHARKSSTASNVSLVSRTKNGSTSTSSSTTNPSSSTSQPLQESTRPPSARTSSTKAPPPPRPNPPAGSTSTMTQPAPRANSTKTLPPRPNPPVTSTMTQVPGPNPPAQSAKTLPPQPNPPTTRTKTAPPRPDQPADSTRTQAPAGGSKTPTGGSKTPAVPGRPPQPVAHKRNS